MKHIPRVPPLTTAAVKKGKEFVYSQFHQETSADILKTGVYAVFHIDNPNWYYIGSTGMIKEREGGFIIRWRQHILSLSKNSHPNPKLQEAINKLGLNGVRFKIVEICEPDKRLEKELAFIKYYNEVANVYNSNILSTTRKGVKNSEATRKKISDTRKKKKVYQFSFQGELVAEHESIRATQRVFPKLFSSIQQCVSGKKQTSAGFIWSHSPVFEYKSFGTSRPVEQLNENGEVIKEFASSAVAERELKISAVARCCNGERNTVGGFKWRYKKLTNE